MIIDVLVIALIVSGLIFFLGAALGILRFPDFYTRMHAAGKGDTLSTILILMGFALYNLHEPTWPHLLVSAKIFFIVLFIGITSPTSTHALMQAGFEQGLSPWERNRSSDPKEDAS